MNGNTTENDTSSKTATLASRSAFGLTASSRRMRTAAVHVCAAGKKSAVVRDGQASATLFASLGSRRADTMQNRKIVETCRQAKMSYA